MGRDRSEAEKEKNRERAKAWYADPANREIAKERSKRWREAHRVESAAHSKKWRDANPAKRRATWIRSKYQLTVEQYEGLLAHNGTCDSCRLDPATHIDHDHASGQFRGYLCAPCNWAAGHVKDDPIRARRLAEYLRRTHQS